MQRGTCCLYDFPIVRSGGLSAGALRMPKGNKLTLLHRLIEAALAERIPAAPKTGGKTASPRHGQGDGAATLHSHRDDVGASPIHALLVANNDLAISLALKVCKRVPELLCELHLSQPFSGESALHVLAANEREDYLCQAIEIADVLRPEQKKELLLAQCDGAFFDASPMISFGSTVLGFATAFGLKRAAIALCRSLPQLTQEPCARTGFLPIHIAVAQESVDMFDFWLGHSGPQGVSSDSQPTEPPEGPTPTRKLVESGEPYLPEVAIQQGNEMTRLGRLAGYNRGMTPLQLAARLGKQDMFRAILKRSMQQQWRWGPVAQFKVYLADIDSASKGAGNVMESVCSLDARPTTRKMLTESFMSGFIFELFEQKFRKFAVAMYVLRLAVFFTFLVAQVLLGTGSWQTPNPVRVAVLLISMVTIVCEIVREALLWWWNYRHSMRTCQLVRALARELAANQVFATLISFFFTLIALAIMHFSDGAGNPIVNATAVPTANGTVATANQTAAPANTAVTAGLQISLIDFGTAPGRVGDTGQVRWANEAIGALLSLAVLLSATTFIRDLLVIFPGVGVFVEVVSRMMTRDVSKFMSFFSAYLLAFATAVEVLLSAQRRETTGEAHVTSYSVWTKLYDLLILATVGEQPEEIAWPEKESSVTFLTVALLVTYIYIIVFLIIVLLNLLIAMMGHTYTESLEEASVVWRFNYARLVLRMELLTPCKARTFAGECEEGHDGVRHYYHTFRRVEGNFDMEGGDGEGADDDIFAGDNDDDDDDDDYGEDNRTSSGGLTQEAKQPSRRRLATVTGSPKGRAQFGSPEVQIRALQNASSRGTAKAGLIQVVAAVTAEANAAPSFPGLLMKMQSASAGGHSRRELSRRRGTRAESVGLINETQMNGSV